MSTGDSPRTARASWRTARVPRPDGADGDLGDFWTVEEPVEFGEDWYLGPQVNLDDTDAGGEPDPLFEARMAAAVAELLGTLLTAAPGGVLAAAVEDAADEDRVGDLSDRAVVDLAAGAQRLMGWAMATQLLAVGELARRWEHTRGGLPDRWSTRTDRDLGHRAAITEVALAAGVSEYGIAGRLDAALVLPERFPQVWAALRSGHLEWAKVTAILGVTAVLSPDQVSAVEGDILAAALTLNLPDLREFLTRLVERLDPQGSAERARQAQARRSLRVTPGPDATATMALTASAATITAAQAALNRLATAASHHPHDPDGDDDGGGGDRASDGTGERVNPADVLLDLIHSADDALTHSDLGAAAEHADAEDVAAAAGDDRGDTDTAETDTADAGATDGADDGVDERDGTDPGHRTRAGERRRAERAQRRARRAARRDRTRVVLTMPLSTMYGLNEHPGDLSGYGPIPAAMAREIAATGTWVCAVTDDRPGATHGTLLAMGRATYSPTYTPRTSTWEFVVTRDGTCRVPGCRRQARLCDVDHRVPWRPPAHSDGADASGGVTCACNLEALCRSHHRLKHEAGFTLTTTRHGTFAWTTPTGYALNRPGFSGGWVVPGAGAAGSSASVGGVRSRIRSA